MIESADGFHVFLILQRAQHVLLNEATRYLDSTVQVQRGYHGFEGIRKERLSCTPAVPFFPLSKQQMIAQA